MRRIARVNCAQVAGGNAFSPVAVTHSPQRAFSFMKMVESSVLPPDIQGLRPETVPMDLRKVKKRFGLLQWLIVPIAITGVYNIWKQFDTMKGSIMSVNDNP